MRALWLLFRTLNLGYFGSHRVRAGLSVLGIALGVMLMLAILVLNTSLTSSYSASQSDLRGGAQIEVTSNGLAGLPDSTASAVAAIPGVRVAAPVLVEGAQVRGPRGTLQVTALGFDRDSMRQLAARVTAAGSVHVVGPEVGLAVPRQLLDRLGQFANGTLDLLAGGRATPLPVSAVVAPDLGAELDGGRFVGLPLPVAQAVFAQTGRLSSVLVEAGDPSSAGVDLLLRRLGAALGPGVIVQTTDASQRQLQRSTAVIQTYSAFVSVVALLIGAYLVFNTMSVAAVERRREASILLAIGEAPRQLTLRFLAESAVLGLAGTVPGLLCGAALGSYLVGTTPRYIQDAYAFAPIAGIPPWVVAVSGAAGVATAVAAAVLPARSFLRIPPADALRPEPLGESAIDPRLQAVALAAGALLALGGAAGGLVVRSQAPLFLVPMFAGFVLMTPALFTWSTRAAAAALLGVRLGLARLAGLNLVHSPRRVVAMLSATAFSLALVVSIGGSLANLQGFIDSYASHYRRLDLFVSATDDAYAQVPLAATAAATVAQVPGVRAAYASRNAFVTWQGERFLLLAEDASLLRRLDLPLAAGGLAGLDGGGMLVSTQIAVLHHLGVGDRLELQTPAGSRSFPVAGIIEQLAWPDGTMIVAPGPFLDAFGQQGVNQVLVDLDSPDAADAVRAAIRDRLPGAVVMSGADVVGEIDQENSAALTPFIQVRNVAVAVAVVTVFNSMLIAVIQRLRDIGIQRALGVLASEVAAALVLEVVAALVVALVAGIALGTLMQAIGTQFVSATSGLPLRWSFVAGPILQGVLAAAVTAVVGSLYPARRAARAPVLEAIAYE